MGSFSVRRICRALINEPPILFADEPTGALNSRSSAEVVAILNELNAEGVAVIVVTHDAKVAARADRIVYLADGQIAAELQLGRFAGEDEAREQRTNTWLSELGF